MIHKYINHANTYIYSINTPIHMLTHLHAHTDRVTVKGC